MKPNLVSSFNLARSIAAPRSLALVAISKYSAGVVSSCSVNWKRHSLFYPIERHTFSTATALMVF